MRVIKAWRKLIRRYEDDKTLARLIGLSESPHTTIVEIEGEENKNYRRVVNNGVLILLWLVFIIIIFW